MAHPHPLLYVEEEMVGSQRLGIAYPATWSGRRGWIGTRMRALSRAQARSSWLAAAATVAVLVVVLVIRSIPDRPREDHGRNCARPGQNLAGRELRNEDLTQRSLSCAIMERVELDNQNLSQTALTGANLYRARLLQVSVDHVDLSGADLSRARFEAVSLQATDLHEADLSQAVVTGVSLQSTNLRGVNLAGADVSSTAIAQSDLGQADLRRARFANVTFLDSNLRGALLDGATLNGVGWENVVCPDGTASAAGGDSCAGHLSSPGVVRPWRDPARLPAPTPAAARCGSRALP